MHNMTNTPTLAELVYEPMAQDLAREDLAILLEERIREAAELEVKCQELTNRVDELEGEVDDDAKALEALRALVAAIDGAKIGKVARVGSLVVVGAQADFAQTLGDALEEARKLL